MNYINISNTGLETLNINTNLEGSLVATQPIAWSIKQDGNDTVTQLHLYFTIY